MKVDRRLQMELAKNLEWHIREFSHRFRFLVKKIREERSVEEIMELKREMLSLWTRELPLRSGYCYFCLLPVREDCSDCLYGKIHGICSKTNSDFRKIWDKRIALLSEIGSYFRGEEYDNDL